MRMVWPVLLGVSRTLYFAYALWCMLFPAGLAWLLLELPLQGATAIFCLGLLGIVFARRTEGDPNPFQSAFMAWFGTLRWFWSRQPAPMTQLALPSGLLVENPGGYRISGRDLRQVLDCLQPGDILLRGYEGYLDGMLIRRSSRCSAQGFQPGWYTHAALYVGPLEPEDRARVPTTFAADAGYFEEGPAMVVHAMAKGVHTEDILTFCRCDYLAVLRIQPAASHSGGDAAAEARQACTAAKHAALEKIGEKYDFDCSDTTHFNRFSCAELVYYCYRGIGSALGLRPQEHALYPLGKHLPGLALLKRLTLTPDDFYDLCSAGTMVCVWEDRTSAARALPQAAP